MADLPTFVFVPGAWHKPVCYREIIKLLQPKFKCVSITLPSTAGNPDASFKDDLDTAREAISSEVTSGRNVVVVAHSYGGMVANSAIKGFMRDKTSQTQSPTTGFVIGLILVASGFTFTGMAFMDPFFGIPPPTWRANWETGFAELVTPPREMFYHDLPQEEAEYWVSQLTPQSLKSLYEGGEYSYAGWRDVPVWYIGTVEDRGLPVLVQRTQIGMAREMGCTVEHRELQTSHSPFLSQPEATVQIMLEAVDAFTGHRGTREASERVKALITVAGPRLWKPFTWLKFGLPLIFGHMFGRGILGFEFGRRLWRSAFH
ncbi:alpha/beta-hydrolase [Penicillium pulvis]|uniref:alpha/beta-hydrolase n=1 Tax=Penicillium pulvis TaxID=1562058 RepID=UPI00254839B4|nr:alpha/beta-hydrolase [Penicillium pulvis]KAJ5809174.1 alpha/beta-hydrolase [Penicillium pulvis]